VRLAFTYHEQVKSSRRLSFVLILLVSSLSSPHAIAVSLNPNPICIGSACSISFPFTGDSYQWTAPSTGSYTFEVWGAQGGNAGYNGAVSTYGGKGGYAKGFITLTAGQVVSVYVGGQGAGETSTAINEYLAGGFNGGGVGYNGNSLSDRRAAGGGGGTDIRVDGSALSNRVIVAGGGGGGGGWYSGYGTSYPGFGGGVTGGDGYTSSFNAASGYSGKGGTQFAGGAAGTANGGATNGSLGQGGASSNSFTGSSGGGGGYFGGGAAGGGMASGGGSGYVGGVTATTLTAGNASMPDPNGGTVVGREGNGFARIAYTAGTATISIALSGGATKVFKGEVQIISATVDYAGKITFYADGKRIPGCISMQTSIGTKNCNWKPSIQKWVEISAQIVPSGASVATSSKIRVPVVKRSSVR